MAWRMLVLAALVFASGFTLRVAWETFDEPAQAQSVAKGIALVTGTLGTGNKS
jgi:hypothetical protein